MIYKQFAQFMKMDNILENKEASNSVEFFLNNYGGKSFLGGLYRVHKLDDIEKWNKIITEPYPISPN